MCIQDPHKCVILLLSWELRFYFMEAQLPRNSNSGVSCQRREAKKFLFMKDYYGVFLHSRQKS